jgi:hypothetical protein
MNELEWSALTAYQLASIILSLIALTAYHLVFFIRHRYKPCADDRTSRGVDSTFATMVQIDILWVLKHTKFVDGTLVLKCIYSQ